MGRLKGRFLKAQGPWTMSLLVYLSAVPVERYVRAYNNRRDAKNTYGVSHTANIRCVRVAWIRRTAAKPPYLFVDRGAKNIFQFLLFLL